MAGFIESLPHPGQELGRTRSPGFEGFSVPGVKQTDVGKMVQLGADFEYYKRKSADPEYMAQIRAARTAGMEAAPSPGVAAPSPSVTPSVAPSVGVKVADVNRMAPPSPMKHS